MNRLRPVVLLAFTGCLTVFGVLTDAAAQSLWQNRSPRWENPVGDFRALRPGDILMVTIRERTNVQNRDQRQLQKQTASTASGSGDFDIAGILGDSAGESEANQDTSADRRFNGNTEYRSERDFVDRFAVTVIDVQPNGNLLVAGKRHIGLEGDARSLVLSGIVRPVDIKADNSIPSSLVAGLDIRYESAPGAAEGAFINQGWMGKKFNRWWPF